MTIHHPPTLINGYISEKLDNHFMSDSFTDGPTVPFFPTTPTDIDALTETFPYSDSRFAVYDRMMRYRRSPFPHIKSEQIMYYFYKFGETAINDVIEIAQLVQDHLDNEDESAEELNRWVASKIGIDGNVTIGRTVVKPIYFHSMRVFQLEEVADVIDFGTARTYAGNKMIIDYQYHKNYPGSTTDPIR